jgi:hypothetical protein
MIKCLLITYYCIKNKFKTEYWSASLNTDYGCYFYVTLSIIIISLTFAAMGYM